DLHQGTLDIGGHVAGVAADEDPAAAVEDLGDFGGLLAQSILHVDARLPRLARERHEQAIEIADLAVPLELLAVDVVFGFATAAEKEQRLAERRRAASFFWLGAFLNEAAEGRESGSGADEHDVLCPIGKPEARLGVLDQHADLGAGGAVLQVMAAHAVAG